MTTLVKRNRVSFPTLVNDLFDTNIFDFNADGFKLAGTKFTPSVNVTETAKEFKVEAAAPGLEKKDFKVEVENGILTISSEKQEEKEEKDKNWIRKEFSYNQFSRSFQLPDNTITDKIDAKYENGVLKISLPKKEVTVANPKKEVKVS
ncbi:MAG TPA: Hsp20/alpha crystallin family protein [Bacteroidia bacterium]|nr:Hsp20/alpha crystallin family protein [Bacteroidia bacterium]